jgi:hypothetical protein
MSKNITTFHINEVSDHGYHRLQLSIMTRSMVDISEHMQYIFDDSKGDVYDRGSIDAYLDKLKMLCRKGYSKLYESCFVCDEVVVDWLEYKIDAGQTYCKPRFKFDSEQPEALRVAHQRLSRIAKAIAKEDFDPKYFAHRLKNPSVVLATMRRLPSFHEVEFANPDGGLEAFVVDKINPAVDELAAQ